MYPDEAFVYEPPFQGLVPPDPSFDEMKRIVVTERRQPSIPPGWHQDEVRVSSEHDVYAWVNMTYHLLTM